MQTNAPSGVSPATWITAAFVLTACGAFVLGEVLPRTFFSHRPLPFVLDSCETPRKHAPETMAGGVAAFDFDADGDLDIYFTNGAGIYSLSKDAPKYWNRLFANDGSGRFTDATEKAGVAGTGYDTGVAVADYDNDGDKDMFVGGVHRYTLFRNNGDGTFTDVAREAGLDSADPKFGPLWSVGGAWFDYDKDGRLDLFVVNYLAWNVRSDPVCEYKKQREYCHPKLYKPTPNRLYRNRGSGTFEDVSGVTGLRAFPGKGMGAAVADFDLDGRMDVFVSNDKLDNFLFRNRGDKTFEEVGFEMGVAVAEHGNVISGMGVDARDIDNDGYPDIFYVALDHETFPMYRNTGKRGFKEVTFATGLTGLSRSMAGYSPTIFDFDNDGWKDLFVSRGHVQSPNLADSMQIDQHNTVFGNLGGGTRFGALTEEAGFTSERPKRHRGSAHGDFNGDGRIDIAVTALSAPAELWINESAAKNHWLMLELVGTKSNRDGIGARIKVASRSSTQFNHVSTAVGYASSSAGPVHFGLGQDPTADLIEIQWPSGIVQRLKDVTADRVLKVNEPAH